jgi:hypothetical protein
VAPEPRPDPNRFLAEFGFRQLIGRITALEGQGGLMRVTFEPPAEPDTPLETGQQGVLQLHDGARFRVVVLQQLADSATDYRVRLVAQEESGSQE